MPLDIVYTVLISIPGPGSSLAPSSRRSTFFR